MASPMRTARLHHPSPTSTLHPRQLLLPCQRLLPLIRQATRPRRSTMSHLRPRQLSTLLSSKATTRRRLRARLLLRSRSLPSVPCHLCRPLLRRAAIQQRATRHRPRHTQPARNPPPSRNSPRTSSRLHSTNNHSRLHLHLHPRRHMHTPSARRTPSSRR